jgi:hypothetical protein
MWPNAISCSSRLPLVIVIVLIPSFANQVLPLLSTPGLTAAASMLAKLLANLSIHPVAPKFCAVRAMKLSLLLSNPALAAVLAYVGFQPLVRIHQGEEDVMLVVDGQDESRTRAVAAHGALFPCK